jgi:hypothetical protein
MRRTVGYGKPNPSSAGLLGLGSPVRSMRHNNPTAPHRCIGCNATEHAAWQAGQQMRYRTACRRPTRRRCGNGSMRGRAPSGAPLPALRRRPSRSQSRAAKSTGCPRGDIFRGICGTSLKIAKPPKWWTSCHSKSPRSTHSGVRLFGNRGRRVCATPSHSTMRTLQGHLRTCVRRGLVCNGACFTKPMQTWSP